VLAEIKEDLTPNFETNLNRIVAANFQVPAGCFAGTSCGGAS